MAATEKISITLTKQMKEALDACVASGEYASISEIIRESIRKWQDDRWETPEQIAYMKRRIQEALDDPRPSIPAEEVWAELEERMAKDLEMSKVAAQ